MQLKSSLPERPLRWPDIVQQLCRIVSDPHQVYMVGGAVRDALRGVPITDIDLVTHSGGSKVARRIADQLKGEYYTLDPDRDVGRAIIPVAESKLIIDSASFRGDSLLTDLSGRDFTINAMAVSLDRLDKIIDPLDGQNDLFHAKILRQCNPQSIVDDPLRAIRAVRFTLQYGLKLDKLTLQEIEQSAGKLFDSAGIPVQPERIRDEVFKLFKSVKPGAACRILNAVGLLHHFGLLSDSGSEPLEKRIAVVEALSNLLEVISPKRNDNSAADLILGVAVMVLDRFRKELQAHLTSTFADQRARQTLLSLACISTTGTVDWDVWATTYCLSNSEKLYLSQLDRARGFVWNPASQINDRAIYRYFRDCQSAGVDGALIWLAEYLASHFPTPRSQDWGQSLEQVAAPLLEGYFHRGETVISPPSLLTGDDLQHALHLQPGPVIGSLLESIREERAAGSIHTQEEALQLATRLLNQSD